MENLIHLVNIMVTADAAGRSVRGQVVALGPRHLTVRCGVRRVSAAFRDEASQGGAFMDSSGHLTQVGMKQAQQMLRGLVLGLHGTQLVAQEVRAAVAASLAEGFVPFPPGLMGELAAARRALRARQKAGEMSATELAAQVKALEVRRREAHRRHGQFLIGLQSRLRDAGVALNMLEVSKALERAMAELGKGCACPGEETEHDRLDI